MRADWIRRSWNRWLKWWSLLIIGSHKEAMREGPTNEKPLEASRKVPKYDSSESTRQFNQPVVIETLVKNITVAHKSRGYANSRV
jgi:hypothetical protein